MKISKEEAKILLTKKAFNDKTYAQNLYEFWLESFDDTIEKLGSERHIHSQTVFAVLTSSYMVDKVKRFVTRDFEANNTISFVTNKRMNILIIKNKLAIRFKKLNKKYLTSNIKTNQVADFKNHKLDFLEEDASILSLDFGYRLDELQTKVDEIFFVCPRGLLEYDWKLSTYELNIGRPQSELFEIEEENIIPVISVKPHLKKQNEQIAS